VLPTGKTFFDDLRALTRYMLFVSWDADDFMMEAWKFLTPKGL
jgi:hypothetical protein